MARTTLRFKDVRRWALVAACVPLVMLAGCPQNQGAAKAKVPAQGDGSGHCQCEPAGNAAQAVQRSNGAD